MMIFIGSDHRGFALKKYLIESVRSVQWHDIGVNSPERFDYPLIAQLGIQKIKSGFCQQGVLICGSGVGVSIAANRAPGIYAGLCWSVDVARQAKADDNINILVLPADFVAQDEAVDILNTWLKTAFKGGHYQDRIAMIDAQK